MKGVRGIIGSIAIAICFSNCTPPVVELDLSSGGASLGQSAILEWVSRYDSYPIDLVQVDARPVQLRKSTEGGLGSRNLLKLSPGKHKVLFQAEKGFPFHPDVVEFDAEAGKQYRVEFEDVNFKETDGKVATFYFNFAAPVVFEVRNGTPVRNAPAAISPFKALLDAEKNFLLYEDPTLLKEKTACVYIPLKGLLKVPDFSIAKISGEAGDTRIEYQEPSTRPWQMRVLPGVYRFGVTMSAGTGAISDKEQRITMARRTVTTIALKAEAGHTYRINGNIETVDTQFSRDVIGRTQMTNAMRWNPAFEDVTGKTIIDK